MNIAKIRSKLSSNKIVAERQILDSLPSSMCLESKMIIVNKILKG